MRRLEIGPGKARIPGFETLDVVRRPGVVDHVGDASRRLPFPDGTFDLVYASHVLEHLPWYRADQALREWVRVLAPGGALEVWTVNAYTIALALALYEETGVWSGPGIGPWKAEWVQGDPYKWCAGRLFCYAKAGLDERDPYWHHGLYTPKSLKAAFERAGLVTVRVMDRAEVRGKDHGAINLGVAGVKP